MTPPLSPKDRIILPLDFDSAAEAMKMVGRLREAVGLFKVGLTLFVREGPSILKRVFETAGDRIFLDLKFHDIPETVKGASTALLDSSFRIRFVTVHASGGEPVLKAAVAALGKESRVLGVTVLTSTGNSEARDLGFSHSVKERVVELAKTVRAAGGVGVVCSGREAGAVKEQLGNEFLVVVPGVRPDWARISQDDQRRISTPGDAVEQGADYLVVGRPILRARDPVHAAERIAQEIDQGLRRRPG